MQSMCMLQLSFSKAQQTNILHTSSHMVQATTANANVHDSFYLLLCPL